MALTLGRGMALVWARSCKSARNSKRVLELISVPTSLARNFGVSLANRIVINIQDEDDFRARVVESSLPVIVDFHATWCGPCKLLGPKLEAMVDQHEGKVVLAKVDIDDNSELAMAFKVQAVPTVMAMKGGKVVDGFMGLKDEDQLKTFLGDVISA